MMSYLIALYVYYHGNNLAMFGVTKGAREEDLNNGGMKRPDEISPDLVDKKVIADAKAQQIKEQMTKKELDWSNMLSNAIKQSQQETFRLHQSKLLNDTVFDHTPEAIVEDYGDDSSIPLDFFSEMNTHGTDMNQQQNQFDPFSFQKSLF